MDRFGQSNIRGQVALQGAIDQGTLPRGFPLQIWKLAARQVVLLLQACRSIDSGACEVSLAIGIEKLLFPDDPKMLRSIPILLLGLIREVKNDGCLFISNKPNIIMYPLNHILIGSYSWTSMRCRHKNDRRADHLKRTYRPNSS